MIDLQNSNTWKIELTIAINFISSKDAEEEHVMRSRTGIAKFTSYNDVNGVADELFDSLHSRYQGNLETSMRGSYFILDSVQLMYDKCHTVNIRYGGWYIDSPDWIKKETTINPKIEDDKYFQYVVMVTLNYGKIGSHPERVSNIKRFINKYN